MYAGMYLARHKLTRIAKVNFQKIFGFIPTSVAIQYNVCL